MATKTVSFNGKTFEAHIKTTNEKQVERMERIKRLESMLRHCAYCETKCVTGRRQDISIGLLKHYSLK